MTIELTRTDTGTRRTIALGEQFSARLPENPTTGYRWQADYNHSQLTLLQDAFHGPTDPPGTGGERRFTFQATHCGLATLRLARQRSWESTEPIEEFSIQLDIQRPTYSPTSTGATAGPGGATRVRTHRPQRSASMPYRADPPGQEVDMQVRAGRHHGLPFLVLGGEMHPVASQSRDRRSHRPDLRSKRCRLRPNSQRCTQCPSSCATMAAVRRRGARRSDLHRILPIGRTFQFIESHRARALQVEVERREATLSARRRADGTPGSGKQTRARTQHVGRADRYTENGARRCASESRAANRTLMPMSGGVRVLSMVPAMLAGRSRISSSSGRFKSLFCGVLSRMTERASSADDCARAAPHARGVESMATTPTADPGRSVRATAPIPHARAISVGSWPGRWRPGSSPPCFSSPPRSSRRTRTTSPVQCCADSLWGGRCWRCSRCGSPTNPSDGPWYRRCSWAWAVFSSSRSATPWWTVLNWVWPPALLALVIWMSVQAHRQLHSRSRRWLLYPVFAVMALASVGGGYETVREARGRQRLPDAGSADRRRRTQPAPHCTGSGSPTVVLQPGGGDLSSAMGVDSARGSRPHPGLRLRPAGSRVERARPTAPRTPRRSQPTCTRCCNAHTFQDPTCWPVTPSAASTSSPTPTATPTTSPAWC